MTRYLALDAFRGITIALMILVNTPGSWAHVYPPLLHADWHGATPTDFVFPFFLFIIGSAMFFSFKKSNFLANPSQVIKIIKRGLIMFFIGFMLNVIPFTINPENWRIMGVLQRIGIAYIIASCLVLMLNRKGVLLISAFILLAYWALLLTIGDGALTLEGNIIRQLDLSLLGASHMYTMRGVSFDPEGILSTIPAVVSMLLGFEVTRYLTSITDKRLSVIKLTLIGGLAIGAGALWSLIYIKLHKAPAPIAKPPISVSFITLSLLSVILVKYRVTSKPSNILTTAGIVLNIPSGSNDTPRMVYM